MCITTCHRQNKIEQKMQSFHHDLSTMTSLSAKKIEKTILLSQEKSLKLTMASNVLQSYSSVISNW